MHQATQTAPSKISRSLGLSFKQFELLLLLILGAATLCFIVQTAHFLPVISDNMYPEAAGVVSSLHWAKGLPLYEDFRTAPYLLTPFTPLWYGGMALAAKLGLADIDKLTLFGRLLSLFALAGIALIAFAWNRRSGLSSRSSLLAPALLLSFPILIPWAVNARPDLPTLFLCILAIYWMGREISTSTSISSGVLAALAFLTRHNAVAVPVAVVLWLVSKKKWKQAVVFSGVWWLVVGATLVSFQISTHGLFLLNLGGSKFGAFAITYIRDIALRLLTSPDSGFVILLFGLGVYAAIEATKDNDGRNQLLSIYLVAALFFAVLGSAAAGAAINHYMESAIVMAMLAPSGFQKLGEAWVKGAAWTNFVAILLLLLLLPSLDMMRWNLMHQRPDDLREIVRLVGTKKVLTDISYVGARSSSPQLLDPASLTYAEQKSGVWSSQAIVNELQRREYEIVVLNERADIPYDPAALYPRYPHFDANIRAAITHSYTLCLETQHAFVYIPISTNAMSPSIACSSPSKN